MYRCGELDAAGRARDKIGATRFSGRTARIAAAGAARERAPRAPGWPRAPTDRAQPRRRRRRFQCQNERQRRTRWRRTTIGPPPAPGESRHFARRPRGLIRPARSRAGRWAGGLIMRAICGDPRNECVRRRDGSCVALTTTMITERSSLKSRDRTRNTAAAALITQHPRSEL